MKDDPKVKDDAETSQSNSAPRKLKIKSSALRPPPDPPECPAPGFTG